MHHQVIAKYKTYQWCLIKSQITSMPGSSSKLQPRRGTDHTNRKCNDSLLRCLKATKVQTAIRQQASEVQGLESYVTSTIS